jgi:ABC-type lipoprotein export system ATPase subunit
MEPAVLKIDAVSKEYIQGETKIKILKNITAQFQQGQRYALSGISGSGKSTCMHILAGLDTPTTGAVFFNDQNIAHMQQEQRDQFLNTAVGLVFQEPYLIDSLSVLHNVMLKGLIAGQAMAACTQRALELLATIGLADKADVAPPTLSGGQQQRVAILRALFNNPQFLIADEPTGNLDSQSAHEVMDLLLACSNNFGMGLIIISHDAAVIERMTHRFVLQDGVLQG